MNTWFATVPLIGELSVPFGSSRIDLVIGAGVAADIGLDYIGDSHPSVIGQVQLRARLGSQYWGLGVRTSRAFRRYRNEIGYAHYFLRSQSLFLSTEIAVPRGR